MSNKKDIKLFFSLLLWSLLPSIYLLFRMRIVSINNVDINILGQMEWFDLIDEMIVTTLTVPLYYLLKPNKDSSNKNGLAFVISFGIYSLFTILIACSVSGIAEYMNAEYASRYLLLQSISLLIGFIGTFVILLLTVNEDYKTIYKLTILKLILLTIFDYVMISRFFDIGSSYSEIIVNSIIAIIALLIIIKKKIVTLGKVDNELIRSWIRIGLYSGLQIFLDNYIYAVMICKMVNAVSESGNYWVANNFIWGWLLIPVTCISEIIKKNNLNKLTFKNTWVFGLMIIIVWVVTMPMWPAFLKDVMLVDSNTILKIVYPLVPFYITYIVSSFIDAWIISKGKTKYMMYISFIVNIVYYGIVYILFNKGLFACNMNFIIMMFGIGMVVHMLLSIAIYTIEITSQD